MSEITPSDRTSQIAELRAKLAALEGESNAASEPRAAGEPLAAPDPLPVVPLTDAPAGAPAPSPAAEVPYGAVAGAPAHGALTGAEKGTEVQTQTPAAVDRREPSPVQLADAIRRLISGQANTEEQLQEIRWLLDGIDVEQGYANQAADQQRIEAEQSGTTHVVVRQP